MKSFKEYLVENGGREYDYRIKIAGELTPEVLADIKQRLEKYDTISVSDPKKTPIQKTPAGFPGIENQEVNIIDFKFQYPASLDEIREQVFQAGVPLNNVMVVGSHWDDSIDEEMARIEDKEKTSTEKSLLDTEKYPANSPEQKKLNKEHGNSNMDMAKRATGKQGFKVAGGTTPKAKTTNDLPQNNESPLSKANRNPKPTAKSTTK